MISLYLVSIALVAVYWSAYVKTLNGSGYTRTSLLLCVAMCFYILGYAMELNSSGPPQIEFWNRVEYIGIPFVSALWLTTSLLYTGHFSRHKVSLAAAIYLIPIVTMALRFTNDYHHLYFSSVSYVKEYGRLILMKKTGPWMYVQTVHSMLMILVSMWLLIRDSVKIREGQKGKILLTTLASVFAIAGLLLSQIRPFGFVIDYMALCLPITCVLVILAVARFDFLGTKSMARSRVFECINDAVLLISRQEKILDYNNSAKRLFERMGIHLNNGYASKLFDRVPGLLEGLQKDGKSVVKIGIGDEERYYVIITRSIDEHQATRGWIKILRDVTKLYQLNSELKKQAMTDELSRLNNRRAFIQLGKEWVSKANENGISLHLSMLDLDHFKNVNDQYGHPAGDLVIQRFGRMLKQHFGADSLVARLGGEEFAVLQPGLNDDDILQMLNSFLESIRQYEYIYCGCPFHVNVSIGTTRKRPCQTLESMMLCADKALYQSKNRGRNCITVFDS